MVDVSSPSRWIFQLPSEKQLSSSAIAPWLDCCDWSDHEDRWHPAGERIFWAVQVVKRNQCQLSIWEMGDVCKSENLYLNSLKWKKQLNHQTKVAEVAIRKAKCVNMFRWNTKTDSSTPELTKGACGISALHWPVLCSEKTSMWRIQTFKTSKETGIQRYI